MRSVSRCSNLIFRTYRAATGACHPVRPKQSHRIVMSQVSVVFVAIAIYSSGVSRFHHTRRPLAEEREPMPRFMTCPARNLRPSSHAHGDRGRGSGRGCRSVQPASSRASARTARRSGSSVPAGMMRLLRRLPQRERGLLACATRRSGLWAGKDCRTLLERVQPTALVRRLTASPRIDHTSAGNLHPIHPPLLLQVVW